MVSCCDCCPNQRRTRRKLRPARRTRFAGLRKTGGLINLAILRNRVPIQQQNVRISQLATGPLRISASREGQRLRLQVGDLPPLSFEDLFPLKDDPSALFGISWPLGVGVKQVRGSSQGLPALPSPLEQGDELYADQEFADALAFYRAQGLASKDREAVLTARYKEGLCLIALQRGADAGTVFEELARAVR